MRLPLLLLLISAPALAAEPPSPVLPDQPVQADPPVIAVGPAAREPRGLLQRDPDAYSIISVARGFSTHRPMYLMPLTYSPDYQGRNTEVVFQISAKQRLFNRNFYFGYTQKSFWQLYNKDDSSPFRETNYNPEFFYRWTPDPERFHHWGADIGIEHESNGKELPDSRSWNRVYVAPFQARGKHLAYLKFWHRLPEKPKNAPDDPKGDDNPDIDRYYGFAELHFQRQFGRQQQGWIMLRGNPGSGRGAVSFNYSWPNSDDSLFYNVNVWHGYGESLIDYDNSVTRLGVGIMFSR